MVDSSTVGLMPERTKSLRTSSPFMPVPSLTAPEAGVCCRIDLLEGDGNKVTPVEYKRGEAPKAPAGLYDPHLIQLAPQCLALQENGFQCDEGMIYDIRSQERVPVKFDVSLTERTKTLSANLRAPLSEAKCRRPCRAAIDAIAALWQEYACPMRLTYCGRWRRRKCRKANQKRRSECSSPAATIRCLFMWSARGRRSESAVSAWRSGPMRRARSARPESEDPQGLPLRCGGDHHSRYGGADAKECACAAL